MFDYRELLDEDVNPEDVDVSYIQLHNRLNPLLWDRNGEDYVLKEEVRAKLMTISDKFSEFIRYEGSKIVVDDIVLTGSNCNYNYTPTSDLDLHLIVDYSSVSKDEELLSEYLFNRKVLWGLKYDIKVQNIQVECYTQDKNDELVEGSGYYSLIKNEWISKPDRKNIVIDLDSVKEKAAELMNMAELAETAEQINKLKDKLRKMRYSSLHSSGEFSVETLAYKILRSNGTLNALNERLKELEVI